MSWSKSPRVEDCRNIARQRGDQDEVIIISVNRREGTIQTVTYGKTESLRADAKRLGVVAFNAVSEAFR